VLKLISKRKRQEDGGAIKQGNRRQKKRFMSPFPGKKLVLNRWNLGKKKKGGDHLERGGDHKRPEGAGGSSPDFVVVKGEKKKKGQSTFSGGAHWRQEP